MLYAMVTLLVIVTFFYITNYYDVILFSIMYEGVLFSPKMELILFDGSQFSHEYRKYFIKVHDEDTFTFWNQRCPNKLSDVQNHNLYNIANFYLYSDINIGGKYCKEK